MTSACLALTSLATSLVSSIRLRPRLAYDSTSFEHFASEPISTILDLLFQTRQRVCVCVCFFFFFFKFENLYSQIGWNGDYWWRVLVSQLKFSSTN